MRVMGIDYGDARTGIAMSDLLCSIVGTTTVIHSRNPEKTAAAIAELVKEHGVTEIVMGLPKNMDGTEGARAELCREFAKRVEKKAKEICTSVAERFGGKCEINWNMSTGPVINDKGVVEKFKNIVT